MREREGGLVSGKMKAYNGAVTQSVREDIKCSSVEKMKLLLQTSVRKPVRGQTNQNRPELRKIRNGR